MIPFNIPPFFGTELQYVQEAVQTNRKICGDGPFTKWCSQWIEERFNAPKALLTTSGTSALEMAALLCDIVPGDEVILPSFTFSTTATSFLLAGAKLVFVDIRPDTKNIDETKIEAAITERTKVIAPVHYAGVSCDMEKILAIASAHQLFVVEDAAQGVMGKYRGRALGTLGDFGCYSFHETKNYSMGEGGAIVINRADKFDQAEIIREKGTNRSRFFRGQVDKYTWVSYGSSYLPSDMNAAYLRGQLEAADAINERRLSIWGRYMQSFKILGEREKAHLPIVPEDCQHNAHMFYLVCRSLEERTDLIEHLKARGIQASFHYVPLHTSPAGRKYGRFNGIDVFTTAVSNSLVRLPLYYGLEDSEQEKVISSVLEFYGC